MNKIAQDAAKGHAKDTKKGGYVTEDGQIFDLGKEGKNFCLSYCGNKLDAWQFNEKGEFVEAPDEEKLRAEAMDKLKDTYSEAEMKSMHTDSLVEIAAKVEGSTDDQGAAGGSDDGDEVDLDKMNKAELIAFLVKLDPTQDAEKLTKAKPKNDDIKDLIQAANDLNGEVYPLDKMKALAIAFGAIPSEIEALDNDDLRHVVLFKRDNVELPESVSQKMSGAAE